MLCDEARRRLSRGDDPEAEAHLVDCDSCFEWLEVTDPVVGAVRAAKPPQVDPSPALAERVLAAWSESSRPSAPSWALWGVAAAAIVVATVFVSALLLSTSAAQLGGRLGGPVASGLGGLLGPVPSTANLAVAFLADHPVGLVSLAAVALLAGLGWARIYLRLDAGLQRAAG